MTYEEFINRPMDGDRVIRALFGLFCMNYDDLELREVYRDAMDFYEAIEVGEREKEVEDPVRANGDHAMRGMPGNICPLVRASA